MKWVRVGEWLITKPQTIALACFGVRPCQQSNFPTTPKTPSGFRQIFNFQPPKRHHRLVVLRTRPSGACSSCFIHYCIASQKNLAANMREIISLNGTSRGRKKNSSVARHALVSSPQPRDLEVRCSTALGAHHPTASARVLTSLVSSRPGWLPNCQLVLGGRLIFFLPLLSTRPRRWLCAWMCVWRY